MLLDRLGITDRVDDVVVLALERGFFLGEHPLDDLTGFVERLEAAANRFEIEPEALMLQLKPSGAEPEVEPAAARVIERRSHLRGAPRITIGVASDERADTRAFGV